MSRIKQKDFTKDVNFYLGLMDYHIDGQNRAYQFGAATVQSSVPPFPKKISRE